MMREAMNYSEHYSVNRKKWIVNLYVYHVYFSGILSEVPCEVYEFAEYKSPHLAIGMSERLNGDLVKRGEHISLFGKIVRNRNE